MVLRSNGRSSRSRRDLFRMIAVSGQTPLVRSLGLENQAETRQPGLDHRRTVAAVRRLFDGAAPPAGKIEGGLFASLQVGPECKACGTCVRSCPNGALQMAFDEAEQQYMLAIRPSDCIGCEVCLHICSPQAIHIDHSPTYQEIFTADAFKLLSEGSLRRCARCNQLFAPVQGSALCPVCTYRREHPFSAGLPQQLRPKRS